MTHGQKNINQNICLAITRIQNNMSTACYNYTEFQSNIQS